MERAGNRELRERIQILEDRVKQLEHMTLGVSQSKQMDWCSKVVSLLVVLIHTLIFQSME